MLKKGLIAGFINLIIGILVNIVLQAVLPSIAKEYQKPGLMRPWSDPLMTIFFAYPFITGAVLSYFWTIVGNNFKGSVSNRAFQFAKLYFVIATIPGMFISYTSFQVSFLMILSWTAMGFVGAYVAGFVFAKIK